MKLGYLAITGIIFTGLFAGNAHADDITSLFALLTNADAHRGEPTISDRTKLSVAGALGANLLNRRFRGNEVLNLGSGEGQFRRPGFLGGSDLDRLAGLSADGHVLTLERRNRNTYRDLTHSSEFKTVHPQKNLEAARKAILEKVRGGESAQPYIARAFAAKKVPGTIAAASRNVLMPATNILAAWYIFGDGVRYLRSGRSSSNASVHGGLTAKNLPEESGSSGASSASTASAPAK